MTKKPKTNSEVNAQKILVYLKTSESMFFKNNASTRQKLGMNFAEINLGTRILQESGILERYTSGGCYKIHREK